MSKKFLLLAALASVACIGGAGTASATTVVIDLAGANSAGLTFTAPAGVYEVSEVAGAYSAADLWTTGTGPSVVCPSATAGSCTFGYVSNLDITVNGKTTEYFTPPPAGSTSSYGIYDTAADALSAFQTQVGPIMLDLTSASTVNFKVDDTFYFDNSGGLSLAITPLTSAVPEPTTWALMIAGLGVLGFALRRRSWTARVAA